MHTLIRVLHACAYKVHVPPWWCIWAAAWENVPSDMSAQRRLKLACAYPRSLIRVFFVRMKKLWIICYTKQDPWWFWSDCANAQADLNLRWAHMSEGTFSDIATNLIANNYTHITATKGDFADSEDSHQRACKCGLLRNPLRSRISQYI